MSQIALPLDWPVADDEEDFLISSANRIAFEHLKRWSLWPVSATLLTGPAQIGPQPARPHLRPQDGGRLFDDAEDHDEEALFHAWNERRSRGRC
jgi:hypothetical protein